MSKKSKSATRSRAQKKADEKLFLKLLKNEASKKPSQGKQKAIAKTRRRHSNIFERTNRKGKPTGKNVSAKNKVSFQTKGNVSGKNVGTTKIRPISGRLESGRLSAGRQRGKEQIDFAFSKVRAVDKKINVFKQQSGKAIKNQLKRHGGKPPRGIVVTVYDKKGREHTRMSPLDFVVNENTTENFVTDMLSDMKEDFMEWKEMEDDTDANPYGDFNPDTIHGITIKFIY